MFLEMGEKGEISARLEILCINIACFIVERCSHLVDFDTCIFADDTRPTARCIEQHPVKPTENSRELATVIITDHDVLATQAMNVRRQALRPCLIGIVGKDDASVLHERRNIR